MKHRRHHRKGLLPLAAVWVIVLTFATGMTAEGRAPEPLNTITIDNQSGQYAEVKVMGPSKEFLRVPLEGKRTVHVKQGEYYILVRYGFSPKEYVYTKSDPFMVTEPEGKFSIITFTLHRIVAPNPGTHQVSEEEFESATLTKEGPP